MTSRIELTIQTDYLPNWGAYEGVREILQNARDAEVQHSASMEVDWYNNTLRILNEGVILPIKALLLGYTTKANNDETIGKFGEGFKLGILALLRAGHSVKIRNGSDVWTPAIEASKQFNGAKVLTFYIESGRKMENRVRIEIGNITAEDWKGMKDAFLFLGKQDEDSMIPTTEGRLLLDPKYKHKIFVKGIFVQSDPKLDFGYDFRDAELDRDRRMIASWDVQYKARRILVEAAAKRPDLFESFFRMLEEPTLETEDLGGYGALSTPGELVDKVAARFKERFGERAVPVANIAESRDVEHLGLQGIVVSKPLAAVLAQAMGNLDSIKEGSKKEVLKKHSWFELTVSEQQIFLNAVDTLNKVEATFMNMVDIVDFRSPDLMGQYDPNTGRITLSRTLLDDFDKTLRVLIHERAHAMGGSDGDHSHVSHIEDLWMKVYTHLRLSQAS